MKLRIQYLLLVLSIVMFLPGCEIIGGIFKAGVWVGILAVVAVVALILYIAGRGKK